MNGQKATNTEIISAYAQTGNIWKAAERLGMCGQSVWERLRKLGIKLNYPRFSEDELRQIRAIYQDNLVIDAQQFGRTANSIYAKATRLGLIKNPSRPELPPTAMHKMKLRMHWRIFGSSHGSNDLRTCPTCGRFFFIKHSAPNVYCSRVCVPNLFVHGEAMFSRAKSGKRDDLGGQYFRSRYEANYARYLNFCIEHGADIQKWEFEADTFEFKPIKKGTRFFTPDFKITYKDGHIEYHEVKGWDYPKGQTARKRMAKYYPHIKLFVIDEEFFKAIRKQGFHRLIPGWETL